MTDKPYRWVVEWQSYDGNWRPSWPALYSRREARKGLKIVAQMPEWRGEPLRVCKWVREEPTR